MNILATLSLVFLSVFGGVTVTEAPEATTSTVGISFEGQAGTLLD